jgi:hypothetical protein
LHFDSAAVAAKNRVTVGSPMSSAAHTDAALAPAAILILAKLTTRRRSAVRYRRALFSSAKAAIAARNACTFVVVVFPPRTTFSRVYPRASGRRRRRFTTSRLDWGAAAQRTAMRIGVIDAAAYRSRRRRRHGHRERRSLTAFGYFTSTHDNPFAGAQFCPTRHPPAPWKSTQRIDRQSSLVTHGLRLMLHCPALHVSCAQSESTRQVQKPFSSPSSTAHFPAQYPFGMPGALTHVPPRLHSSSVAHGSAWLMGHVGLDREHAHWVKTTTTSWHA